jgi:hypothetical protein
MRSIATMREELGIHVDVGVSMGNAGVFAYQQ